MHKQGTRVMVKGLGAATIKAIYQRGAAVFYVVEPARVETHYTVRAELIEGVA